MDLATHAKQEKNAVFKTSKAALDSISKTIRLGRLNTLVQTTTNRFMKLRIFSISLGCPKTRVDTEHLLGSLHPLEPAQKIEDSDLVFINTCGFIKPAVQESVQNILQAAADIEILPREKRPLLAVAGCLPARYGVDELAKELPEVDIWLNLSEIDSWAEMIKTALKERAGHKFTNLAVNPGRMRSHASYAYIKISEGCEHKCAFCTIPAIRGPLKSFPRKDLTREAEALTAQGVKELVLVAQDLTAYGRDLNDKQALRGLLEDLARIDGLARLRLMYLYPSGLTRDFLNFLKSIDAPLLPYFDVPVQHSHPEILAGMGRPFSKNAAKTIDLIREIFPEAALRTSLIVGYPGEREEHFEHLLDFVRKMRFHNLGAFAYQQEEGTKAALLAGQLSDETKEKRRDLIMQAQAEISEEILAAHVGSTMEILVDEPQGEWPGLWIGRAWFQAPEVDGITYISGESLKPGDMAKAEIVESGAYDLQALA